MAAHQAPPSLGFSRQEHWSGLPFLLQCMKVKSESEVAQLCPTPSDPMDCSLPGSSDHGIVQAKVLEWGAIAYSQNGLSRVQLFETPWSVTRQALLYLEFSRRILEWVATYYSKESSWPRDWTHIWAPCVGRQTLPQCHLGSPSFLGGKKQLYHSKN